MTTYLKHNTMQQGDIVIIPFPFTDLSQSKLRPALVISNNKYNKLRNVILIAISTQKGEPDFTILLKQSALSKGELKKISYIRLQNIFSAEKRLIIKVVAKLTDKQLKIIVDRIYNFI